MADLDARIAVLEADQRSHTKSDDERYGRIDASLNHITDMITDIGRKLDDGLKRAHELRELDIAKVRHDIANAAQVTDIKVAKVAERAEEVSGTVTELNSATQAKLIALLVAVVAFFLIPFFTK